jgi:hypothetical protein
VEKPGLFTEEKQFLTKKQKSVGLPFVKQFWQPTGRRLSFQQSAVQ